MAGANGWSEQIVNDLKTEINTMRKEYQDRERKHVYVLDQISRMQSLYEYLKDNEDNHHALSTKWNTKHTELHREFQVFKQKVCIRAEVYVCICVNICMDMCDDCRSAGAGIFRFGIAFTWESYSDAPALVHPCRVGGHCLHCLVRHAAAHMTRYVRCAHTEFAR